MLSCFPHLTESEFDQGCNDLIESFQRQRHKQNEWISVETVYPDEMKCLRISKTFSSTEDASIQIGDGAEYDEVEEDDEELLPIAVRPERIIHYDIILSPVYRVPVLYISIADALHRYPPTMATLYQHLIPPQFRVQTESVGVIGGITITDHPATNRPVFFIHPCQTAEVIEASVGKRDVTTEEYLMIWIGAFGKCVGLTLPLALAQKDENG